MTAYSSKEKRDNLKELKTFYSFTGSVCFSSCCKWCRPIYMVPVLGLAIFL